MNTPFIEQRIAHSTTATLLSDSELQRAASAVSWSAIFAGAAAAAAISLILLILGTGLGLSSVSPWVQQGVSAQTFGISTIIWVTLTQLIAFGLGGYIAGRLRTKWLNTDNDEVYFRDTAHGLLSWAIASLASAVLLTSVIGSIISGGAQVGATAVGGVTAGITTSAIATSAEDTDDGKNQSMNYLVDSLFRKDMNQTNDPTLLPNAGSATQNQSLPIGEVTRIFMYNINSEALPAQDVLYLGQIVAKHTGLSQQDSEARVKDTYANLQKSLRDMEFMAKQAADNARKASMYAALWLFVSLLIGAFCASLAATYGGRQRDAEKQNNTQMI